MSYRILLVDDDKENLLSTRLLLEQHGYQIDVADSGHKAVQLFRQKETEYAVVLMDYFMPGLNGVEATKEILKIRDNQLIAMYSCDDSKQLVKEAIRARVVDYIEKEISPDELLVRIRNLCSKYEQTAKTISTNSESAVGDLFKRTGIVGSSEQIAKVAEDIDRFAKVSSTVLINGETGTGKEMVARALHTLSDRSSAPFIAINCAAIPENLLESTLFGHEKGAFTGAHRDQAGKFVLANRGTLLLDEIGDVPLHLQAKLLRVLQEKTVEPVGSNRTIKVDVRIIAATHKNLAQLVKEGKFREDLYYRLNVITMRLPALRERPEDIEALVAHFTKECAVVNGTKTKFEYRTLAVLKNYRWPGNVRELKHMVESHLIQARESTVKIEHLDSKFFEKADLGKDDFTIQSLEKKQKSELRHFIKDKLKRTSSKSEAARSMGISPSRLHYYVETLEIRV